MKYFINLFLLVLYSFYSAPLFSDQSNLTVSQIVQKYGKCVVLISTQKDKMIGLGSGFIIDPSGIIITNYHVIEGANPASVEMITGETYPVMSVINYDKKQDLAIIKINANNLPKVVLGDSSKTTVGEQVVVIGNPEGLQNTVSDGLISAIRNLEPDVSLYQISAPISPGSSGSPIFNLRGEVIGIANASLKEGQNLNFSIPSNLLKEMMKVNKDLSLEDFSLISLKNKVSIKPKPEAPGRKIIGVNRNPGAKVIIPDAVRTIMIEGVENNFLRNDISFSILGHMLLPAQTAFYMVSTLKFNKPDARVSNVHAFVMYFNVNNDRELVALREVYIPTNINLSDVDERDIYTYGYALLPGKYLLSMAIASQDLTLIGTQHYEFEITDLNRLGYLETSPILFLKDLQNVGQVEQQPNFHKNTLRYSVLNLTPNWAYQIRKGEKMDLFFIVYGAGKNVSGNSDLTVKYDVYQGTALAITFQPAHYDAPLVSHPLPTMQTVVDNRGRSSVRPLEIGSYTLVIRIMDNVTGLSTEKRMGFDIIHSVISNCA
jgi:hypothetical protein